MYRPNPVRLALSTFFIIALSGAALSMVSTPDVILTKSSSATTKMAPNPKSGNSRLCCCPALPARGDEMNADRPSTTDSSNM